MRILALDTALDACSAAVLAAGRPLARRFENRPRGHGERIAAMVVEVLEEAEVRAGELDRICVTIGPGSFTGVRIGLATARGYGLALGLPVVGITTLAAVAAPHWSEGAVLAAHDARRRQVYVQVFAAGGAPLARPAAMAPATAAKTLAGGAATIVGSGAHLVAEYLADVGDDRLVEARPEAAIFGRLAAALPAPAGPPEPLYLRTPDAMPRDGRA